MTDEKNGFDYKVREVFNLNIYRDELDNRWVARCEIMIDDTYEIIPITVRANEIHLYYNGTPILEKNGTIRIGDCNTICFTKSVRFYEEWEIYIAEQMEVY